jgi:hypothetical protein
MSHKHRMARTPSSYFSLKPTLQKPPTFLRIDKLPVEPLASPEADPIAAKNVQELLGGGFGEMSTLTHLLQLAGLAFCETRSWSGFARVFRVRNSKM